MSKAENYGGERTEGIRRFIASPVAHRYFSSLVFEAVKRWNFPHVSAEVIGTITVELVDIESWATEGSMLPDTVSTSSHKPRASKGKVRRDENAYLHGA